MHGTTNFKCFYRVFHVTQKAHEPGPPPPHNIPEVFVVSVTYL